MRCALVVVPMLLLLLARSVQAQATDCVPVWVYPSTLTQPAGCDAVDLRAQLRQHGKVCSAASLEQAVVTVRLTSCREQAVAALPPPGLTVPGSEFVVHAQATEGKATKELAGLSGDSWQGAARDLCRAIAVWHASLAESR